MVKNWQKLNSKSLGKFRIFDARRDRAQSPRNGKVYEFDILEVIDWINIIPITPEGKVVMIYQYRHGTEEITLEVPGGTTELDDPSPKTAARRELIEETGFDSDEIIHIGTVTPNPAFLDNRCHTFLALNAFKVSEPEMDGAEDITVKLFDVEDIPGMIASGEIDHALVVAAFYHYESWKRGQ